MNHHKCDCTCSTQENNELFDHKNLLLSVLCSCKLPTINQKDQIKESTDLPNSEQYTLDD